jgi:hypothetical protein
MDLADKLKMALDEGRLLILLLTLERRSFLDANFNGLPGEVSECPPGQSGRAGNRPAGAYARGGGPDHALDDPSDSLPGRGSKRSASRRIKCAELGMVPMTLGLGATTFVVFESLFNRNVGVLAGITFAIVAFSFFYALGLVLRIGHKGQMPPAEKRTLLKNKIEQLLTEARVIIPGAQALLGFQFVVVFVRSFGELPGWVKITHAVALAAIALSVVLLMTPAALHRIAYDGENSQSFFRISSALVVAAAFPLAVGIAADICVVGFKITGGARFASLSGCVSLLILVAFWFLYPLWLRHARGARV